MDDLTSMHAWITQVGLCDKKKQLRRKMAIEGIQEEFRDEDEVQMSRKYLVL